MALCMPVLSDGPISLIIDCLAQNVQTLLSSNTFHKVWLESHLRRHHLRSLLKIRMTTDLQAEDGAQKSLISSNTSSDIFQSEVGEPGTYNMRNTYYS